MKVYNYGDKQINALIRGMETKECAAKIVKGQEGKCPGCKIIGNGDGCMKDRYIVRIMKPLPELTVDQIAQLTERERQVYHLSAAGESESKIAVLMNISVGRVSNLRKSIRTKAIKLTIGKTPDETQKPVERYYVA